MALSYCSNDPTADTRCSSEVLEAATVAVTVGVDARTAGDVCGGSCADDVTVVEECVGVTTDCGGG